MYSSSENGILFPFAQEYYSSEWMFDSRHRLFVTDTDDEQPTKISQLDRPRSWFWRMRTTAEERGWGAAELAKAAGLEEHNVAKYWSGKVQQPRGSALGKIANALDVSESWLRDGIGEKQQLLKMFAFGRVNAGGAVDIFGENHEEKVDVPFGVPPDAVALVTSAGGAIVAWPKTPDLSTCISQDCIARLESGVVLRGEIYPAQRPGAWLIKCASGDTTEAPVEWAAPVEIVMRRALWRSEND